MKTLTRGFSGLSCVVAIWLLTLSVQANESKELWKYKNIGEGENYTSDWIIEINNGVISGVSYWYDNGVFTGLVDRLSGQVTGGTVSITRYLSGIYDGKTQTFTGTISNANISGTWGVFGCASYCQWTAAIIPLSSSSSGTCTSAATLDANLKLHVPALKYQPALGNAMNLWADLQFAPGADGSLMWKLSNYGVNP